jgi:hypothetical protein
MSLRGGTFILLFAPIKWLKNVLVLDIQLNAFWLTDQKGLRIV